MSRMVPEALGSAIKVPAKSVRERPNTALESQSSDNYCDQENLWFVEVCVALIGKDAGFGLHTLTGWEERTCYRYAAGTSKSPTNFYRRILHTRQGWQWLCAIMEGCTEQWWDEVKLQRSKLEQRERRLRSLKAEIEAELSC